MMKKLLFMAMLMVFAKFSFAQTTYYWAGGATGTSLTSGANWSLTLGGAATTSRNAPDDILIFDNQNVVFDVTSSTCGKIVVRNSADVTFSRASASGAGGTTLTLAGVAGDGLEVNNAKLRINGAKDFNFTMALGAGVLGSISNGAEVYIMGAGNSRISASTTGLLTFGNETSCFINSATQPFNTYSVGVNDNSVFFDNGSTLIYQGGSNPFGNSTSGNVLKMAPNSNYVFEVAPSVTGFFTFRSYGNVLIKSGVTINLAENFVKMNDLTIEAGATLGLRTTGAHAIAGNLLVNGTLGVNGTPTSSHLIMIGTSPQTISGSGTINTLGCFTVANDANVTLLKNLVINGTSTSNIIGRLNLGTSIISGTCNLQFRSAATLTDISNTTATILNSNLIQIGASSGGPSANYNALSPTVGLLVTGPGIPANSYIIGTSSGSNNFTISNFATATATNQSITTTSGVATLSTANTGGPDASLVTTGNGSAVKAIGSGTNLIINAATTVPFATTFFTSGGAQSNISYGDVSFNADATTNTDATITALLTLNSSKLTIRIGDNLTISSTSSFAGASSSAYIVTAGNTSTGAVGTLKLAGVAASKSVPVGSATNYLPVTLNPTSASDFSINVFEGATADATPNGAALSAGQKAELVNAIYNINRTTGTGNCTVTLGWQAGLEGANFSGFSDAEVGVAKYTSGAYTSFVGPGNNTANTITATISDNVFGPFLVGKVGTLPVKLISFTAKAVNQTAVLNWTSTNESNLDKFTIQRSTDGVTFENLGSVKANNKDGVFNYSFTDKSPVFGANYYRLVSVDLDATTAQSDIQVITLGSAAKLAIYPNPTNGAINLSGLAKGDVIRITDLVGRVIKTQEYLGDSVMNLSLDNALSGIYLLSVSRNGQITSTNRIVKN